MGGILGNLGFSSSGDSATTKHCHCFKYSKNPPPRNSTIKIRLPVSYEYGPNKIKQAAQFLISTLRKLSSLHAEFCQIKTFIFQCELDTKTKTFKAFK